MKFFLSRLVGDKIEDVLDLVFRVRDGEENFLLSDSQPITRLPNPVTVTALQ